MGEFYYELTLIPTKNHHLFLDLLLSLDEITIEEKENSIILRDENEENLQTLLEVIEEFAKAIDSPYNYSVKKIKNQNWIDNYKKSIKPIEIGNFYIRAQWHEERKNKINIIINPALAFGSGHHETTASCIEAIDEYVNDNDQVLDVGCGSGILSIAASKKKAIVDICDTDEQAIESALENISLNDTHIRDHWVGSANKSQKKYDLVIANIIADIIILIKKDLISRLNSNGVLILSGIIESNFHKIEENFSEFETIKHIKKGEWHTLVLKKS